MAVASAATKGGEVARGGCGGGARREVAAGLGGKKERGLALGFDPGAVFVSLQARSNGEGR